MRAFIHIPPTMTSRGQSALGNVCRLGGLGLACHKRWPRRWSKSAF